MAYKSRYRPQNVNKYMGDPHKIICRSMWERKVCKYLDSNKNILRWSSEEISIPYYSTVDRKMRRYYPDFLIEKKGKENEIDTILIEVKPLKQTIRPKRGKKTKKSYLNECMTYETNLAKWKYAREYCKQRGWKFLILTEKDIFSNK
jgi:hypothetical protein|tara:strand:+ start:184 stop:624 length:441 start_codon:yes stop_codon:yes gene_type:complete